MKNNKPEEVEFKLLLFWSVYYIDKSLSLRLGRSTTIPDWDITVPDLIAQVPNGPMGYHYYHIWARTARVQGKIYEQLYSPESVGQPDHVRIARVNALVRELKDITVKADEINVSDDSSCEQLHCLTKASRHNSSRTEKRGPPATTC